MYRMFLVVSAALAILSCKSYSKYPIDAKASIKPARELLGIWKAIEDTNKFDFILVQNSEDVFKDFQRKFEKYKSGGSQDKKIYDDAYNVYLIHKDHYLYLTRMMDSGRSSSYRQFRSFFSTVGNQEYLNIEYRYSTGFGDIEHKNGADEAGYLFFRILKTNPSFDTITLAVISDTTLKQLKNSSEVRRRIANNIHVKTFYGDTLVFYKVSGYHASLDRAVIEANPKKKKW